MLIYGPATVISQRTGMEAVFAGAGGSTYLDSLGLCDRWTNYTAHPAQTPGQGLLQHDPASISESARA